MSGEFAGALAERLTVLRRTEHRDALGGADGDWIEVGTIWASVRPARARPDAAGPAAGWRVTVRAEADVRPGDRLRSVRATMRVLAATHDAATPDRLTLEVEAVR